MATVYGRAWLREQVQSYIHDNNLDTEAETWVDLALKEVSRVLRCKETLSGELVDLSTQIFNVWTPPADFIEEETVIEVSGEPFNRLPCVVDQQIDEFQAIGKNSSRPLAYFWSGNTIQMTNAASTAIINVAFHAEVQLDDDAATHPAVTAFPGLFLDAVKAQAYDWKEDTERQAMFEQKWRSKATELRRLYEGEKYGTAITMRAS